MPKAFMEYEDANGDGKVSGLEFKGPQSDFDFFDVNGDGMIEFSEAPVPGNLPAGLDSEVRGGDQKDSSGSRSASGSPVNNAVGTVTLNGIVFDLYNNYDFFTWKDLPADVNYERSPLATFTGPDGATHYYEAVYVSSVNLNWFQAAFLAQDAGGYLASITSAEENAFVFNLVSDKKFFWFFPHTLREAKPIIMK